MLLLHKPLVKSYVIILYVYQYCLLHPIVVKTDIDLKHFFSTTKFFIETPSKAGGLDFGIFGRGTLKGWAVFKTGDQPRRKMCTCTYKCIDETWKYKAELTEKHI